MVRSDVRDDHPPVLVLAPLAGDAAAIVRVVEYCGLPARACAGVSELRTALSAGEPDDVGAFFVVIAEEGAGDRTGDVLMKAREREPPWSSTPVVVLARSAAMPPPAYRMLNNGAAASSVLLERPVRPDILASVFRNQAEARLRQFEIQGLIDSLAAADRRKAFLLDEVRHRTRNSLSVLQSLFTLTARKHSDIDSFVSAFQGRIQALATAHGALADEDAEHRELSRLIAEHVGPYCVRPDQLRMTGPAVTLSQRASVDLAMVVHELATNAAKYGALSTAEGTVAAAWSVCGGADGGKGENRLALSWTERGGPPVSPPQHRGLGSQLIETLTVGGSAYGSVEYRTEGLVWRIGLPASEFDARPDGAGHGES